MPSTGKAPEFCSAGQAPASPQLSASRRAKLPKNLLIQPLPGSPHRPGPLYYFLLEATRLLGRFLHVGIRCAIRTDLQLRRMRNVIRVNVVVRNRHPLMAVWMVFDVDVVDVIARQRSQIVIVKALLECRDGHHHFAEYRFTLVRTVNWSHRAVRQHSGFEVGPVLAHALDARADHYESRGNAGGADFRLGWKRRHAAFGRHRGNRAPGAEDERKCKNSKAPDHTASFFVSTPF